MKTIVIIGAGEGMGFSLAKKFGANGFQIALVARNKAKLDAMVEKLKNDGIEAAAFPADIINGNQMDDAFAAIKAKYGFIDVLEFSPTPGSLPPTTALEMTEEGLKQQFDGLLLGALKSVKHVLPEMLERGEGALLFTTPISSVYPFPPTANAGIIASGLRTYARILNMELKSKGIYVGHLALGLFMEPGDENTRLVANTWYDMYVSKEKDDDVCPAGITLDAIWTQE